MVCRPPLLRWLFLPTAASVYLLLHYCTYDGFREGVRLVHGGVPPLGEAVPHPAAPHVAGTRLLASAVSPPAGRLPAADAGPPAADVGPPEAGKTLPATEEAPSAAGGPRAAEEIPPAADKTLPAVETAPAADASLPAVAEVSPATGGAQRAAEPVPPAAEVAAAPAAEIKQALPAEVKPPPAAEVKPAPPAEAAKSPAKSAKKSAKKPAKAPAKSGKASAKAKSAKSDSPKLPSIHYLKGSVKVGDMYSPGFAVPHEDLCPNNGRDLSLLVMVTTAPGHGPKRRAVRQTWGHFALRKDVALAFLAGRTEPAVQAQLDEEQALYGDVVQTNNVDQYRNLTLKTVAMFEWVMTHCAEVPFVLKTDDDMFINMPLLLNFVSAQQHEKRTIFGRLAHKWKPIRNKKSKYFVDPSHYSLKTFPDFTTGPAYLFTSDIVPEVYHTLLNTTYLFLEDVLTTGIVGEYLGIKRLGDARFKNDKTSLTNTCKIMDIISIHMVGYAEQFDLYKRTLDGKTSCKHR